MTAVKRIFLLLFVLGFSFLQATSKTDNSESIISPGAESTASYFPLLRNMRIGILTNHTGMVNDEHLVDLLHREKFDIRVIFAPEHGFRGDADAGEKVNDDVDARTGIKIYSLYKSKTGKPDEQTMQELDVIVFDLQDVGLRYYTYYISMYKMMEMCAKTQTPMIILDRPNPNGFYVDGPILDMKYKSGVGYLPIPVVHGMTLGELALMINGEKWLPEGKQCPLTVIKCENYTHQSKYELPIAPSPNLPNMKSIYLYASTCFFEGTPVSLGRGTSFPFQVYGHPSMKKSTFSFTPRSIPGAKNPPLLNKKCNGVDLRNVPDSLICEQGVNLEYLIDAYNKMPIGEKFFKPFFQNLIGVDYVKRMILEGKSAKEIKDVWRKDVEYFKEQRKPYLIYSEVIQTVSQ